MTAFVFNLRSGPFIFGLLAVLFIFLIPEFVKGQVGSALLAQIGDLRDCTGVGGNNNQGMGSSSATSGGLMVFGHPACAYVATFYCCGVGNTIISVVDITNPSFGSGYTTGSFGFSVDVTGTESTGFYIVVGAPKTYFISGSAKYVGAAFVYYVNPQGTTVVSFLINKNHGTYT